MGLEGRIAQRGTVRVYCSCVLFVCTLRVYIVCSYVCTFKIDFCTSSTPSSPLQGFHFVGIVSGP